MPAELNCYFYSSLTTNLPKLNTLLSRYGKDGGGFDLDDLDEDFDDLGIGSDEEGDESEDEDRVGDLHLIRKDLETKRISVHPHGLQLARVNKTEKLVVSRPEWSILTPAGHTVPSTLGTAGTACPHCTQA